MRTLLAIVGFLSIIVFATCTGLFLGIGVGAVTVIEHATLTDSKGKQFHFKNNNGSLDLVPGPSPKDKKRNSLELQLDKEIPTDEKKAPPSDSAPLEANEPKYRSYNGIMFVKEEGTLDTYVVWVPK